MILSKIQFNFLICALSIGVLSACGMEPLTSNDRDRNLANARALEYNDEVINGKLAPPKGFVQQSLFSQRVSGNDARFERLESAVQALHDTLKSHLPAIEKLSAIESDIEELVGQLQTLVSEPAPNAAPPIDVHQEKLVNTRTIPLEPETPLEQNRQKNSPAFKPIQAQDPIPSTPTPKLPPAPILDADYNAPSTARTVLETTKNIVNEVPAARTVNNIRVSQGPDKTRVVLDSTQKIDYTLEYDGQEVYVVRVFWTQRVKI